MRYLRPLWALIFMCACGASPQVDEHVLSEEELSTALAKGDTITQATFAALTQRLQLAMADGGPVNAVDQCQSAARPITDSLSVHYGVRVKRTSARLRSSANRPDAHEQERLKEALAHVAAGNSASALGPQVFLLGDSIAFYKPILITSPLCLKCHGSPGVELDSAAHALITERYPGDAAVGYALGELRGYWSVRWPRTRVPR